MDELQPTPNAPALRLEDFVPYRLNRISELVSKRFSAIYSDRYGLTRPDWRTLAALGQFGTMTATAIALHSAMHKTKVSRAVANLSNRKWLLRQPDPSDARVEHLSLTRDGRRVYLDLATFAHAYGDELQRICGPAAFADLERGLRALETALGAK